MYLVVVTYGTWPDMVYAKVGEYDHAESLRRLAKRLGYSDARVWRAKDFYEAQTARRFGPTR